MKISPLHFSSERGGRSEFFLATKAEFRADISGQDREVSRGGNRGGVARREGGRTGGTRGSKCANRRDDSTGEAEHLPEKTETCG